LESAGTGLTSKQQKQLRLFDKIKTSYLELIDETLNAAAPNFNKYLVSVQMLENIIMKSIDPPSPTREKLIKRQIKADRYAIMGEAAG